MLRNERIEETHKQADIESDPLMRIGIVGLSSNDGLNQARQQSFWQDLAERRDTHGPITPRNSHFSLMFGQLVALVATSVNAASFTLEYGLNKVFPLFLMFWSYLILSCHLYWSINENTLPNTPLSVDDTSYRLFCLKLRAPWWYYLCLSVMDVGPNYLALLAMNRTSLTSATLLGSLTIPSTMFFCRLLLRKEYRPLHFAGVVLCMMGGAITILMDKNAKAEDTTHPDSLYGDMLCILAALGYGIGDAAAELCSKHIDRVEYVGMIGLFGMMWCLVIFPIFEWEHVVDSFADTKSLFSTMLVILWYIASLVGYYVLESLFLKKSDATLLNLSLQTSNFWAILFSIIVFHEVPELQFYVAVSLVTGGVACYELCGNWSSKCYVKDGVQSQRLVEARQNNETFERM